MRKNFFHFVYYVKNKKKRRLKNVPMEPLLQYAFVLHTLLVTNTILFSGTIVWQIVNLQAVIIVCGASSNVAIYLGI